jgi:membrane associated rhomboid family serine protease
MSADSGGGGESGPGSPGSVGGGSPPSGVAAVPTCYRHAGRETYVSCVRCGRPICADCMIEAPVGFQCPECVHEGRASQRVTRTPFGGKAVGNRTAVTYTIIGLNVAAMLVELAWPEAIRRFDQVGGPVYTLYGGQPHVVGVAHGEYYRLLTSMFLHASPAGGGFGITHILFNMWALAMVGPPLEAWLGRVRFVTLYLLSGLAGSVVAYLLAPANQPSLGASGAVFGLFGALFVLGRRLRFDMGPMATTIGLNLVITFLVPGISWQAHIGGLVAGGALAAAWGYAPRDKRTVVQVASSVALAAILVVIVIMRTHTLTG